ncbi:hypothetical protein [Hydrogenophaga sp. BPS33]|uniref:hypothetical protein n=1 Tax=Hydrogenophaga sp. BPS33 TaxID=2651974 RepID=UPI00131FF1A9|nr:hypothetical protein [Hydrogenophaga sp. BPS33]QHE86502.1 hypothetical protein F9K07_17145 [Hydrogenophaga sp. BPS33]
MAIENLDRFGDAYSCIDQALACLMAIDAPNAESGPELLGLRLMSEATLTSVDLAMSQCGREQVDRAGQCVDALLHSVSQYCGGAGCADSLAFACESLLHLCRLHLHAMGQQISTTEGNREALEVQHG